MEGLDACWLTLLLSPERGFYPEFVHRLDKAAHIMAQDFAQHFVHLRHVRLTSKAFAEFRLNHAESLLVVSLPGLRFRFMGR